MMSGELRRRLAELQQIADTSFDVGDLEPALRDLLAYLQSAETDRVAAERELIGLIDDWPPGAIETLEFTMRELRWEAVRAALEAQLQSEADFRFKDQARQVLQVFEADWPGGEIYATYRSE